MRYLTNLLLLCLAASAVGFHHKGQLLKKYGFMKIMSSCLGEGAVNAWKLRMRAACEKCHGEESSQVVVPTIQDLLQPQYTRFGAVNNPQVVYVAVPYNPQQPTYQQINPITNSRQQRPRPNYFQNQQIRDGQYVYSPSVYPSHNIQRRGVLTPEKVKMLKKKMMYKVSNITCALKELELIDDDGDVNYDRVREEMEVTEAPQEVKEDLYKAIDKCRNFASCMPVDKHDNMMSGELGSFMAFHKCFSMKKAMTCMKHDIRQQAELLGYGDQLQELMSEDDDSSGTEGVMSTVTALLQGNEFFF